MTLLQLLISLISFVFLIFAIDAWQRGKLNLLHFLVFFGGGGLLFYFLFYPKKLDQFGGFFGVARGADLVVYGSIIFLTYLFFELINKLNKQDIERSDLIRALSLQQAWGSLGEKNIVFIIPAYNEGEVAVQTVQDVLDAGYGVVYIDDGSPRISQVDSLKKRFHGKNLVIIEHILNLGQGAALQTGSLYLQKFHKNTKFVVHFDSDGQMQLRDVQVFLKKFEEQPTLDIVLGSRNLGKVENMPFMRRVMKKLARGFMRLMVGLDLTDTHNGFRVMRYDALPKLRITLNRMAHASEIEHLIALHKLQYAEVPVHILYTDYSLSKGQKISGMRKVFKDFIWKVLFYK